MSIRPKRPLTDEEFNFIYSKVPRVCVQLICKNSEGIMFTKRAIKPAIGVWHLPGGTIIGETYEEAAHRVAIEELGVDIEIQKVIGILNYLNSENSTPYCISIMLQVTLKSGEIVLDEQASEYQIFKEIPQPIEAEVADFFQKHQSDIFD